MEQEKDMSQAPCAHLMAPGPARPLLPLVAPLIDALGFHLLRIRLTGDDGQMVVQVMAENADGGLRIEDCETISHAVSDMLDVENPIAGAYTLEVSSPGLARPLTRPVDFDRWAGHEAKIGLRDAVDGQRRFRGALHGFGDNEALLEVSFEGFDSPQILGFALDNIAEARLVPDALALNASLKAAKRRNAQVAKRQNHRRGQGGI